MAAGVVVTLPEQQALSPDTDSRGAHTNAQGADTLLRRRAPANHGLVAIGMQLAFWRYRLTDQANYSML